MQKEIKIKNGNINIPAILWGKPSDKILIEIHGNLSHKSDVVISLIANRAVALGYQVLSFDLPEHGDRINEAYKCVPANCISDLQVVYHYAATLASNISIFGCSMGAYYALLAYHDYDMSRSLFLSPVVNMKNIIDDMMQSFDVSEEKLKLEKLIKLPIGQTLDWDYYSFVKANPIDFEWDVKTDILYGAHDKMCKWQDILDYSTRYDAKVRVDQDGEHYYHTEEHLRTITEWLGNVL